MFLTILSARPNTNIVLSMRKQRMQGVNYFKEEQAREIPKHEKVLGML